MIAARRTETSVHRTKKRRAFLMRAVEQLIVDFLVDSYVRKHTSVFMNIFGRAEHFDVTHS